MLSKIIAVSKQFRTALKVVTKTMPYLAIAPPAAAVVLAFIVLSSPDASAQAQDLKGKAIRVVVPFPPGGTADDIVRLVTQQASTTGYKFVVESRPGAGTIIGT